jgi:hypothetical protein
VEEIHLLRSRDACSTKRAKTSTAMEAGARVYVQALAIGKPVELTTRRS